MTRPDRAIAELLRFPLVDALTGRRSRRFGFGMEIPSGPLAFRSTRDPLPLTETETYLLVAAATGVSGWSFGIPFGPRTPRSHAEFTVRFTGRTAPTAAGIGAPALFFTDDQGCYCTRTRDAPPTDMSLTGEDGVDLETFLDHCRSNTIRISEKRLDLPSSPPHVLPPNLWWANHPGSTLFMPVGDASEVALGLLALMVRHGVVLVDEHTGEPAGNLAPFFRSGLLDREKRLPLRDFLGDVHECVCMELAMMGHNVALMLQPMGLGGLFFNGLDMLSVLGARADAGIRGLGFRFDADAEGGAHNVVGLDGVYEALCPPYLPDMHAAVEAFVDRKFGEGGAYDERLEGAWKDGEGVKRSVEPYSRDFIDCMSEVARYMHRRYGRFPGTRSTIMLPAFVQAHHLDTDFYDSHYREGAYLHTHAAHLDSWHV